jgi:hypothetical protein
VDASVAKRNLDKLLGTVAGRGHWVMLGLSSEYLQTIDPQERLTGYAEGLFDASGFVAVNRRRQ